MSNTEDTPNTGEANPEGDSWVIIKDAAEAAGVSVSTIRKWYGSGAIPSRLEPGPTGKRRVVPLAAVVERAGGARTRPTAQEAGTGILTMEAWQEMNRAYLEAQARAEDARVEAVRQTFAKEAAEREQLRAAQEAAQLKQKVADLEERLVAAQRRWWKRS